MFVLYYKMMSDLVDSGYTLYIVAIIIYAGVNAHLIIAIINSAEMNAHPTVAIIN